MSCWLLQYVLLARRYKNFAIGARAINNRTTEIRLRIAPAILNVVQGYALISTAPDEEIKKMLQDNEDINIKVRLRDKANKYYGIVESRGMKNRNMREGRLRQFFHS